MKMRLLNRQVLAVAAPACFIAFFAQAGSAAQPRPVDPLSVEVQLEDALRFVDLFVKTDGNPSAEQLQELYLDPGSKAIEIFTPWRIESAANLAARIAEDPASYREAIERCLPLVRSTESDLRSIYLGFRGLLPEKQLPQIAVIFGAGNSGGTAQPGMQVLGLEALCKIAPDEASFRTLMRSFYAHETVHTLQRLDDNIYSKQPLLAAAIAEGTADYIAMLVTGEIPSPTRANWARQNETMVFAEFAKDMEVTGNMTIDQKTRDASFARWIGNASNPPEGWPSELGYWVGMRIAQGYVENATDRHTAIRELLVFDDPAEVLAKSGIDSLKS